MVCYLGSLEEQVLVFFERFNFGVEAFEQGDQPFFAVADLLSDLLPGTNNPFNLAVEGAVSNWADVGDSCVRCPCGVSGGHSTPYPTTADLRLVSGAGEWLATCRSPVFVSFI